MKIKKILKKLKELILPRLMPTVFILGTVVLGIIVAAVAVVIGVWIISLGGLMFAVHWLIEGRIVEATLMVIFDIWLFIQLTKDIDFK